ncbi:MAG: hypothetical protein JSU82_13840 [Rhodospirillales bacterium]|nr:MAG: hypothetical protein JSU82_13840 [Rhodospirillales bacterium]
MLPSRDARAETGHWKPRLMGAALWALIGGLSFVLGWAIAAGLAAFELDVMIIDCGWFCGVSLSMLLAGLSYTAILGIAAYRAGCAGRRRAAGFAVLAMPWFAAGWNAGVELYFSVLDDMNFVLELAASMTAGLWLTLVATVSLPSVRSWASVRWLLAGSAVASSVFAAMGAGGIGGLLGEDGDLLPQVTAWCAVYAAAFSMALPRARRDGVPGNPPAA